jgi:hypothetical protein
MNTPRTDAVLASDHYAKDLLELARTLERELAALRSDGMVRTQIKRFTAYRRNISQRDTHNELQKNPDDQPQYEGVIFTDGSVALRWRTAIHCTSVWSSLQDALSIHGHPEYGSEIVWHDGETPQEWSAMIAAAPIGSGE